MTAIDDLIQQAITQAKAGDRPQARKILAQVVKQAPGSARAWYLLSQVVDSPQQAEYCLKKVLEIDPANARARQRLQALEAPNASAPVAEASIQRKAAPAKKPARKSSAGTGILAAGGALLLTVCALVGYILLGDSNLLTQPPTVTDTPAPAFSPDVPNSPGAPLPSITPLPLGGRPACIPLNAPLETATVTSIVDGDTIHVLLNAQDYTLRYIGIDTPETVHPAKPVEYFGPQAYAKNKELVLGKTVTLVKDVSDTDQYGRLLRYVFVGGLEGTFVNYELVRQGYAYASTYPPDIACASYLAIAEQSARNELDGLWGPTPIPSLTPLPLITLPTATQAITTTPTTSAADRAIIIIAEIFFDGASETESDEYAVITNQSTAAVNLKGWRLNAGADGQDFIFPAFSLGPGASCRVYTNEIHADSCGAASFASLQPMWNNSGDCGYLYDASAAEVHRKCYP